MKRRARPAGGRELGDTLRVWDRYYVEAVNLRKAALAQPIIIMACMLLVVYSIFTTQTLMSVPRNPVEGYFSAKNYPDAIYVQQAEEVLNLLATYTPKTVQKQYDQIKYFLWEPAITAWLYKDVTDEDALNKMEARIKAIQNTAQSQMFVKIPELTTVGRSESGDFAIVSFQGTTYRYYAGKKFSRNRNEKYTFFLQRVPRSTYNPLGLVVVRMIVEDLDAAATV